MASENHSDERAETAREPGKDLRSAIRPSAPGRLPILRDGPESLRSSDC